MASSLCSKRSRTSEVLWRASEDSSRAKIGARAKKGKERGGVGHPLPAPFPFLLSPQFSCDQNLYSRDT